ncbi:MAG: enoyl-CoA hydratase/isomerase family protein [Gammaproteobacteria bacterium]|nr:enoyl-CoA hydratase/isomerase family protein [Gammaproteobacteria bacterium]
MQYETIHYEVANGVGLLRLARPERLNALNLTLVAELASVAAAASRDPALRALIITGTGRAFCAGADINVLDTLQGPADSFRFIENLQTVFNAVEDIPVPTIAAINGVAFGGGCELALCCDFRLMAEPAKIGVPEIKIGVLPGAGGSQRLPRLLPPALAKQMIYFGDPIDAATAVHHGLANALFPVDTLLDSAWEWAERLAKLPPLALRSAKLLVNGASLHGLDNGIEHERQSLALLFGTRDAKEGIRAFLEKRAADFKGE